MIYYPTNSVICNFVAQKSNNILAKAFVISFLH